MIFFLEGDDTILLLVGTTSIVEGSITYHHQSSSSLTSWSDICEGDRTQIYAHIYDETQNRVKISKSRLCKKVHCIGIYVQG